MYGRHFESMYTGSMIGCGPTKFSVMGYIVAHRRKMWVELNPKLLAFTIGTTEEDIRDAIDWLCQPDPKSRSKEEGGRRLVKEGEYLYRVVNWRKYDEIASEEIRKEKDRIRKREERSNDGSDERTVETGNAAQPAVDDAVVPDPPPARARSGSYHPDARAALWWLNEKAGRSFREVDANLSIISARLKEEGVTIDGVKKMIERQVARWKNTEQEEYLRPETLFARGKFDGYYSARDLPVSNGSARKNDYASESNKWIAQPE